jgi:RNA polymerase sigma-70 factor (ECF subfamily)
VTDESSDPDAALMIAVRAGDERAFATLVRRWQDRVVGLANRYLRSAADAEDLAQEVFLRVHRAKESYEPSAKFSTWIFRITVNASLNQIRARKARRAVSGEMVSGGGRNGDGGNDGSDGGAYEAPDDAAPDPAESAEKDELARVVRRVVDSLPERQRTAILLNKYEGLSYEECAAAMDLTVMALKSLLTRARTTLKTKLEPYLATGELPSPDKTAEHGGD